VCPRGIAVLQSEEPLKLEQHYFSHNIYHFSGYHLQNLHLLHFHFTIYHCLHDCNSSASTTITEALENKEMMEAKNLGAYWPVAVVDLSYTY
jgi:hypothetical protein